MKILHSARIWIVTVIILACAFFASRHSTAQTQGSASKDTDIEVFLVDPYRQAYDPLDESTKLYPRVDWITGKNRNKPVTGTELMKKGYRFSQMTSIDKEEGLWMIFVK